VEELAVGNDLLRLGPGLDPWRPVYLETVRIEGSTLMRYAVVIEKANGNYSAYVPDCIATGATVAAVESEIRDAIHFHIDGLRADGIDVPQPTSIAQYVET
jgi:predicted RNase H-like HicB family nuclease